MEDEIRKLNGVQKVTLNFLTQKLTLETEDAQFDAIVKEMVKVCKKIEPDCEIVM